MYLLSRGSGYPVLFIHGIPTSCQLWSGVIDKLLGRFTCMAVDLPGLGRTPRGPREEGCSISQLEEIAGQIEPQPLGQRQRLRHRLGMVCKSTHHRRRRGEHVTEVAAPHGLGGIERGVQPYGHQRVLERCPGARVRVHGLLQHDPRHGEQLRVESLIELAPDTLAGLEKYLASGLIKGVGPKLAQRIVATFGLDALRVLEEDTDRLREVEGLGDKRRTALARAWRDQRALRDVMVFLQAHGASPALATRIVRRYGPHAMNVVSREPYRREERRSLQI